MITIDQVQQALAEVGRALEPLRISRDGEDTFRILMDEQTEILLELVERQQKLTFLSDVGRPDADRRLTTYEVLLQYNFLWHKTGGIQLSLAGPGSTVIQSYDWFVRHLSVPVFCTLLRNFTEKARVWRGIMQAGGIDGGESPVAEPAFAAGFDLKDALRV